VQSSVHHPKVPEKDEMLRGEMFTSFILCPESRGDSESGAEISCPVVIIIDVDPKGYIPSAVVNFYMDVGIQTFPKLADIVHTKREAAKASK